MVKTWSDKTSCEGAQQKGEEEMEEEKEKTGTRTSIRNERG